MRARRVFPEMQRSADERTDSEPDVSDGKVHSKDLSPFRLVEYIRQNGDRVAEEHRGGDASRAPSGDEDPAVRREGADPMGGDEGDHANLEERPSAVDAHKPPERRAREGAAPTAGPGSASRRQGRPLPRHMGSRTGWAGG